MKKTDIIPVKKELPTLSELYAHPQAMEKSNKLNQLLNQEPSDKWIKDFPMKKGVKYIPIEITEYLLTSIFIKWRVEVKETKLIANSVVVTIRLHVLDPTTGVWDFQDGVGATPLQTDKDAGANDWSKIKNNAVMLAAPSAKSYAIKDAADHLGKIFGKDLNRKDALNYSGLGNKEFDPIQGKKTLNENDPKWELAKKNVSEGTIDLDGLRKHWDVSEETFLKLQQS